MSTDFASAVDSYADGYRRRARAREEAASTWRAAALAQAQAAADVLVVEFGARRVLLFGSLARGEADPSSDVDLLVEGIAPQRWFEACAAAADVVSCGDLDLAPFDKVRPEVLRRAESEGRVLHG